MSIAIDARRTPITSGPIDIRQWAGRVAVWTAGAQVR